MGQKVSPIALRVGFNKEWSSTWFADKKNFSKNLSEDYKIRQFLNKKYKACAISKIVLERTDKRLTVSIYTARPGMLIGTKGAGIEVIKKEVAKLTDFANVTINIKEVKRPDVDASLMAQSIATQLEKRIKAKRAMRSVMQKAAKSGVKGIRIVVSGRVDGAERARSEELREGTIPLHTIKNDIDYATAIANTIYGVVGVKIWINNGEKYSLRPTKNVVEGGKN